MQISNEIKAQCDACGKIVVGDVIYPLQKVSVVINDDRYTLECCRECVKDCGPFRAKSALKAFFKWLNNSRE